LKEGNDSRNLTYCLKGTKQSDREGSSCYGMDLDMNIHFSIPREAASDANQPDNALCRVIFFEADHNTFINMADNVEKNLFEPIGLVKDENLIATYLNRKDFRIVSDEVVDIRHTGSGGIDRPTQYMYNKKIPIRKNLTYVDAYTPTKQLGCVVVGHGAGLGLGNVFGGYRLSWKFTFKDM